MLRKLTIYLSVALTTLTANAQDMGCAPLDRNEVGQQGVGPYDYYNLEKREQYLRLVEEAHFTTDVEHLRKGSTGLLGQDLSYTLNSFPNHPRALMTLARLVARHKNQRALGLTRTADCFFDRAIRFRPDDGQVRQVYGIYLYQLGRYTQSLEQFDSAEKTLRGVPMFHYNRGLVAASVGQWDRALADAHTAYQGGVALPGLKAALDKAGKWRSPPPKLPETEAPMVLDAPRKVNPPHETDQSR
jgi:tetratricopeptide (TPR) repeat protein